MCSPVERRRILEDLAHVRGVHRSVVTLEERLTSVWETPKTLRGWFATVLLPKLTTSSRRQC